jgi:D-alanine--poly(phosphoribitol) ligase subunit 2
MDKILEILTDARPDVDFENESGLFDQGILDSFDIVTIISDLNDAFEINIRVHDLTGENFNSLESIQALIERKKNE